MNLPNDKSYGYNAVFLTKNQQSDNHLFLSVKPKMIEMYVQCTAGWLSHFR